MPAGNPTHPKEKLVKTSDRTTLTVKDITCAACGSKLGMTVVAMEKTVADWDANSGWSHSEFVDELATAVSGTCRSCGAAFPLDVVQRVIVEG